jgi:hypothetical protein
MTQSAIRQQLLSGFAAANPHLGLGAAPPQPAPAAAARTSWDAGAVSRIVMAGGDAAARFLHPTFIPFEKMYRKFPQQGVYQATPQNNFVFELGAFRVPAQMAFALVDYRFSIYRLSGAAAGDWVELEERRLSGQIGYDVLISDYRKANLSYELEPTEIQAAKEASEQPLSPGIIAAGAEFNNNQPSQINGAPTYPFQPITPATPSSPFADAARAGNSLYAPSAPPFGATATDFANARAAAASSPGGPGLSLLPQRHERLGPLPLPFTLMVRENQRAAFKVVVFRPVPIPLAFFEVDVTGILMPANVADSLFKAMVPFVEQGRKPTHAGE